MKLAIVGISGGTHLGSSFLRAAEQYGTSVRLFNAEDSMCGPRIARSLSWRLLGHRPLRLNFFSDEVLVECLRDTPTVLLALGAAPLTRATIEALRRMGIICMVFSSDDPWNKGMQAGWYLSALPAYDVVFTPRRSNIVDFQAAGCLDVRYLPFGFDPVLFAPPEQSGLATSYDVLFVGGADRDRRVFMDKFSKSGLNIALVGGYWEKSVPDHAIALGLQPADVLCALTAVAKVNLCLVRRANRDGHVMRSFEIAAVGGCLLAEDTEEHREIFGAEGECVLYFRDESHAASQARKLLNDPALRMRLATAAHVRVGNEANTYRARLTTMIEVAREVRVAMIERKSVA